MSNTTTDVVLEPQDVLNKLNIIDVQIKTFSGYMTRQDEVLEQGDEVLFTKGSIKIIDPAHVKAFTNSRTFAKRICSAVGVGLAGGYAVSDESTKDVLEKLIALRKRFYDEKALFLQNYDAYVEEQANFKPEHYHLVKSRKPTKEYVDNQLQFEIRIYKMVAANVEGVDNFINDEVGDLKWQLAKEISQDIKSSWKGRDGSDKADARTVGMLKRIQEKLKSLVFLDKRIGEVQNFIGEAIKALPGSKITGRDYLFLVGVIETLADPKRLLNDPLNFDALNAPEVTPEVEKPNDEAVLNEVDDEQPVIPQASVISSINPAAQSSIYDF
jgi:hypothetical protein